MKHTETRYLWTQERLALGHIWTQAKATAVTYSQRSFSNSYKQRQLQAMCQEFREGRALAATRVLTCGLHKGNGETDDDRIVDRCVHFAKRRGRHRSVDKEA